MGGAEEGERVGAGRSGVRAELGPGAGLYQPCGAFLGAVLALGARWLRPRAWEPVGRALLRQQAGPDRPPRPP